MHTLWQLFKKYESVISYLFFGGLTTLINIGVFDWLNHSMNYQIANVLAWLASVIFAFITNKLWVFNSKSMAWKTFMGNSDLLFLPPAFTGGGSIDHVCGNLTAFRKSSDLLKLLIT